MMAPMYAKYAVSVALAVLAGATIGVWLSQSPSDSNSLVQQSHKISASPSSPRPGAAPDPPNGPALAGAAIGRQGDTPPATLSEQHRQPDGNTLARMQALFNPGDPGSLLAVLALLDADANLARDDWLPLLARLVNDDNDRRHMAGYLAQAYADALSDTMRDAIILLGHSESLAAIATTRFRLGDNEGARRALDALERNPSVFTIDALNDIYRSGMVDVTGENMGVFVSRLWARSQLSGSRLDYVLMRATDAARPLDPSFVAFLLADCEDQARAILISQRIRRIASFKN